MKWQIEYFNRSVRESIFEWPKELRAEFLRLIDLLEQFGVQLGMLYSKALGKGLFEIRASGREGIGRAFYCYVKNRRIIILHTFIKKTQKLPYKHMETARRRLKEVCNMKNKTTERYKPVPHNKAFKKQLLSDPGVNAAYKALDEKYILTVELITARKKAHKTQKEVAKEMHTTPSAIARLESTSMKNNHSPSIETLKKYAVAVGCDLKIKLVPSRAGAASRMVL